MGDLHEIVAYANGLLAADRFKDYCPNGLQVEGRAEVRRLISGVTASADLLEAALARSADAIVVHHGYFWRGEPAAVTGMRRRRLRLLLSNDISLLAWHLPLDAHPELGNNAQLAARLGLEAAGTAGDDDLLWHGTISDAPSAADFRDRLKARLGRDALLIGDPQRRVRRIAWCTGAAQSFIDQAAALGVDAFVSGEISEQTVHAARELDLLYFSAGHHATERYGVQALGEHLAQRFGIEHEFVDIDNPV